MRVLYFSRDYTPHDYRFLAALAKTQHKVYYLRLEKRGATWEHRPLPPGIVPVSWKGGKKAAKFWDGPRLWLDLKRVIKTIQPDLIHAGPIQRSAFLAALTGFTPLVSMSWGYDLLVDAKRNPCWQWATQYTLQRSAAFVGDCHTIHDLAVDYGMNPERIVIFPWGVDLDHFRPTSNTSLPDIRQKLGWGNETFVLLSTRGWAPVYGVVDIVRAFARITRQHPEIRLLMLGEGPQATDIHQILGKAKLIDRVHLPGLVEKRELPNYYLAADLYVSASHSDGSSISLLESLACGTPALLSDIPGNKEWVEPGQQGWLFQEGDVDDLISSLHQILQKRDNLPEMGHKARHLAEKRADWDENFPKLLDAYQMAITDEKS